MARLPGEGPHPQVGNPLFGRYDKDPGRYRPQWYYVEIDVPVEAGGVGRGSIQINNEPYALTRVTHKIIGDTADPSTSGVYQDGQYDIELKDEQRSYSNVAIPADLQFGWNFTGYVLEVPFPIAWPGNKAVSIILTNRVTRAPVPTVDYIQIGVCLHGIADLGELQNRQGY